MFTPGRALHRSADQGRELPRIPALGVLYDNGVKFRHGQVIMVAGRSGSQKSGFAIWLAAQWAVPTLYFSADMSMNTASVRLAATVSGDSSEEVDENLEGRNARAAEYTDLLRDLPIRLCFDRPLGWLGFMHELDAYVELYDAYPELIVVDNLMDIEGAESDYTGQMEAMGILTELARNTGATVLIMHHASDKSWEAKTDPWAPPSRDQVKGGLSEKPELSLSVGLDPNSHIFYVACIKQRNGPSDPTAKNRVLLRCYPERTQFGPYEAPLRGVA